MFFLEDSLVLSNKNRKRNSNSLENTESSESRLSFEDIPRKLQKVDDDYYSNPQPSTSSPSPSLSCDGTKRKQTPNSSGEIRSYCKNKRFEYILDVIEEGKTIN